MQTKGSDSVAQSQSSTALTPQPEEFTGGTAPGPPPASASTSAPSLLQHQPIGGPVIGGLATTPLATTGTEWL
jgi:hypothetical protein